MTILPGRLRNSLQGHFSLAAAESHLYDKFIDRSFLCAVGFRDFKKPLVCRRRLVMSRSSQVVLHPHARNKTRKAEPQALYQPVEQPETTRSGQTRVEHVTAELRNRILKGHLASNEWLPSESALAQSMGVSRTVIREAMHNLRAQGLVEVSQGRRARVRASDASVLINSLDAMLQRSEATIYHLLQLRRPLEGEIAALAAEHATQADLEKLGSTLDDLRVAKDLEDCIRADVAFHRHLAEASHNPLFELFLETVRALLVRAQQKTFPLAGVLLTIEGHCRILEAIVARNPMAAQQAMLQHLDEAEEALRRSHKSPSLWGRTA
jgi:GntR family transcriptional regulator, transcriptional repressor for pyruvate dehydrogenase complex